MDLLIIVSTEQSGPIASGLGKAAQRSGISWSVFFTNDGVRALSNREFAQTIAMADKAIACNESWQQHMGDAPCPIEAGSQTANSALVGDAKHVVSL